MPLYTRTSHIVLIVQLHLREPFYESRPSSDLVTYYNAWHVAARIFSECPTSRDAIECGSR